MIFAPFFLRFYFEGAYQQRPVFANYYGLA
jgi:hypothetical protein